jgi:hypothetical protein
MRTLKQYLFLPSKALQSSPQWPWSIKILSAKKRNNPREDIDSVSKQFLAAKAKTESDWLN